MIPGYQTTQQLAELSQGSEDAFRSIGKTYNKLILVNSDVIYIYAFKFGQALIKEQREMLLDVICKHYQNQTIEVVSGDGENLELLGVLDLLELITAKLNIPAHRVQLASTNSDYAGPFPHVHKKPGVFLAARNHINPVATPANADAQFLGTAIGRFTPSRFRLAYEMDQAFPGDAKIVFQHLQDGIHNQLNWTSGVYDHELAWAQTRVFDVDVTSEDYAREHWTPGCRSYNAWSAQFQIDVVAESDVFNYHWLTEKVAKPLATGKPFVLLGGRGSLQLLHDWGFVTFGDIIDESYDDEEIPTLRIEKIIHSLKQVYNSPDRQHIIEQMNQTAQHNIAQYQHFCRN